ncbi:MAG: hypothetical protein PHQ75_05010 [Thermoguttaceae bacterium]|nr:hypothetical protein [Thermoguttaceae bacterium]
MDDIFGGMTTETPKEAPAAEKTDAAKPDGAKPDATKPGAKKPDAKKKNDDPFGGDDIFK